MQSNIQSSFKGRDHAHLVPLRASGTRRPLFCLPGGTHFNEMVALMDEDQPVYSIDTIQFYGARQNCTIKDIAAFYLPVIRQKQEKGPYYLCGYSVGGLIAYEIGAQLANQGEEIGLCSIVDMHNTANSSTLSLSDAVQVRTAYLSDRIRKYGRNLLLGNFDRIIIDATAFITPKPGKISWLLVQSMFRMLNRPIPKIFQINDAIIDEAARTFNPTPYAKRLVLFRAQSRGPEFDNDLTLGWNQCASGEIDVHVIPGDHVSMMTKPGVWGLAEKLTTYLDDGRGTAYG
jgi:thioesterase domain-containing protein